LRTWFAAHGRELTGEDIFRDEGYSGATLNRPGLDRLRGDAVRTGEVEQVLVIDYWHPLFVKHPMDNAPKTLCGARNRQGKPCQSSPIKGKRRCRLHGGATPKGRQHGPMKHGIYSKRLTKEEQALLPTIKVGSVDDEITMAWITLHRLIAMHEAIQAAPIDPKNSAGFYTAEIAVTTPDGKTST
jgi:hypothetical protein